MGLSVLRAQQVIFPELEGICSCNTRAMGTQRHHPRTVGFDALPSGSFQRHQGRLGEALIPWPTCLKAKTVWDVRGSRRPLGDYPGPEVDMRSERILWAGEMALGFSLVAEAPGSCFFQESQRKQEARFREELYCFHDGHPGWLPQPE